MGTSTTTWQGKTGALTIKDPSNSDTEVPVGYLQDVEVSVNRNIDRLRAAGSIKALDKQQTELSIEVSATVAAWDSSAFDTLVDYDSTNSEINDAFIPPEFTVETEVKTGNGTIKTLIAKGTTFENIPISGAHDEWIELDLDGTADDLEITES